jgi:hypothetical protein
MREIRKKGTARFQPCLSMAKMELIHNAIYVAIPVLDTYITKFNKNYLQIHLEGAHRGGGLKTVLALYRYFEARGLQGNIVTANIFDKVDSSSFALALDTGKVYPGI